jgi:hypothetical protein
MSDRNDTVTHQEAVTPEQRHFLRWANALLGVLHSGQGVAILILGSGFSAPIIASYLGSTSEFTYQPRFFIAAFLFLAACDHLLLSLPRVFPWYIANLSRRINRIRWYEYSISASLMIVVIGSLTGIRDLVGLVSLFFLTAAMILFGLLMEVHNQSTAKTNWTAFVLGCVIGAVPWVFIVFYFIKASPGPPGFVYGIVASLIMLYALFPINMWLQHARRGRWRSYIWGEYGYMVLSLSAKSVLAWQVFGGTLNSPALYP